MFAFNPTHPEIDMSAKRILFVVTNAASIGPANRATGYFFPEIAHPWAVLEDAGVAVDFASLTGGAPPEDGYDDSDEVQARFKGSKAFERLAQSQPLSDVDVTTYDAVFVPGGLGPMVDMARNPLVNEALARAWDAGLVVGAVCHGPVALLDARLADGTALIHGKQLTGFSNAEEEGYALEDVPFLLETALREQGAVFSEAEPWAPHVVVDGRLVTGQNPASAEGVGEALAQLLLQNDA